MFKYLNNAFLSFALVFSFIRAQDVEITIVSELINFLESEQLYLGFKPVMWSVVEQTALAEAEIEYKEFLKSCPVFERMLVRSKTIVIKYWFSVSDEEQERRFQGRIHHPTKHWKLSPMDLQSRSKWMEYSKAKDKMFKYTDIKQAPWYVVNGDDKKRARLNVINHLLSLIDYKDLSPEPVELPPRQDEDEMYVRSPLEDQNFIPEIY